MNASMAVGQKPSFFFSIEPMKSNSKYKPRCWNGVWAPSRPKGSNKRASRRDTEKLYFYDGPNQRVNPWPDELTRPTNLVLQSDASVYYDYSRFWAVPFDAINNQVGDGTQGDEPNVQSDVDGGAGSADGAHNVQDWSNIGFDYGKDFYDRGTSYVQYHGAQQALRFLRPDQRWPHELLPNPYRGIEFPNTVDFAEYAHLGGMIGELPIIIALIAFSRPAADLDTALMQTMGGPNWYPCVTNNHDIGRGWSDKRGMVVRVYSGGNSDPTSIRQLELGVYGNLFD